MDTPRTRLRNEPAEHNDTTSSALTTTNWDVAAHVYAGPPKQDAQSVAQNQTGTGKWASADQTAQSRLSEVAAGNPVPNGRVANGNLVLTAKNQPHVGRADAEPIEHKPVYGYILKTPPQANQAANPARRPVGTTLKFIVDHLKQAAVNGQHAQNSRS